MRALMAMYILVCLMVKAEAKSCEVYGISDSPQKLNCTFKKPLQLRCREGLYFVNASPVEVAFHYEVEAGPVPLVFKTKDSKLTVTMHSKRNIHAEFEEGPHSQTGKCRSL